MSPFCCRYGFASRRIATKDRLGFAPDLGKAPAVGIYFLLRNTPSMKEVTEHLVLNGDGLCGLLHLQTGLETASFILLEPLLELFDVFAPTRS